MDTEQIEALKALIFIIGGFMVLIFVSYLSIKKDNEKTGKINNHLKNILGATEVNKRLCFYLGTSPVYNVNHLTNGKLCETKVIIISSDDIEIIEECDLND